MDQIWCGGTGNGKFFHDVCINSSLRPVIVPGAKLNISGREWRAMMAELESVLFKFNVPDAEQNEIVGLIAGLEGDIVTRRDT